MQWRPRRSAGLGIILATALSLSAVSRVPAGDETGTPSRETSPTMTSETAVKAPTGLAKAADFTAKDLQGKPVTLSKLLEKGPVLLDFWTSWCKPCMNELPELDKLHQAYKDRGFTVVAIAQDDPRTLQKVKPIVDQKRLQMVVLVDPTREVGNRYNVRNYPTSFLISQDGSIVHFAQGYMRGDEKVLEEKVTGLLGVRGAGEPEPESSGKP